MARTSEAVKIINHGEAGAQKLSAVAGLLIGAVTGAGAAKAAFNRHGASEEPSDDRTTGGKPDGKKSDGKKSDGKKSDGEKSDGKRKVGAFDRDAAGIDEPKEEKGLKGKLMHFGERKGWHWLGRTLQVQRRVGELNGSNLAAAVTLQVFLSIFPMLLVASAIIGFVVSGDANATQRIVSAMGLTGSAADTMTNALATAESKKQATSIVGFATLLWSALGVTSALQYAYNQTWQAGGRGIKDKAVGLVWMAGAALLFVATAAISTALNWLPAGVSIFGTGVAFALSFGLWLFTAKILPNVNVSWKELIPGAILGAIGLEVLKILGAIWVPRAVESSSGLYGAIGVVFAVLAWMMLFGKLVVYSSVLNVVLYEGKHGVSEQTIEMPKPAAQQGTVTRSGQSDKS